MIKGQSLQFKTEGFFLLYYMPTNKKLTIMITNSWLFKQLHADLIGKDSYRGVTLTYAWMANQFGHFALGFIPTIILFHFIKGKQIFKNEILSSASIITGFWVLFETYNFLWPLLKHLLNGGDKGYVFKPAWGNVAFDTCTDLVFFAMGAFTATLFLEYQELNMFILVGLACTVVLPSVYWFKTKMYQNAARFPFQCRLSQWKSDITVEDKTKVLNFVNATSRGNHLLIFGSKKSGKTSLSIAIANEMAIKHKACTYTTSMKLFSMFFEDIPDEGLPWDWKKAEYLIIDDINPGGEIKDELVQVNEFKKYMDAYGENNENRTILREKNVIWVLGSYETENRGQQWQQLLEDIGVPQNKIQTIDLECSSLDNVIVLREAY